MSTTTLPKLALLVLAVFSACFASPAQTWEQVTPPLSMNYPSLGASPDGHTLLLSGSRLGIPLYLSTNGAATWTTTSAPGGTWDSFAISADGTKMLAANYDPRGIYTSTDGGITWTSNNVPRAGWTSVAGSADGQKLVAVNNSPQTIFVSTNGGTLWTQATNAPLAIWRSVACSADGSKLTAVNYYPGTIYGSADGGALWTRCSNAPAAPWFAVAASADASKLLALTDAGQAYVSADSGSTWVPASLPVSPWRACAASADAGTLIVCSRTGLIFTSTDLGATWKSNSVPVRLWNSVAMSADGRRLFAAADGTNGGVWRAFTTPAPALRAELAPGEFRLGWLLPSERFGLQHSVDCASANWEDATNLPALNLSNLHYEVAVPLSDARFYRLKSQ